MPTFEPAEDAGLPLWEMAVRLLAAAGAAALVGWERERVRRPAGLRTHMLVAIGACLFTLLALDLQHRHADEWTQMDPMRIVAGIIGGVGFLGAGAIMNTRGSVTGLTTAAGVWVVAAIGVAAAMGSYAMLALTAALALVTLALLTRVEQAIATNDSDQQATQGKRRIGRHRGDGD